MEINKSLSSTVEGSVNAEGYCNAADPSKSQHPIVTSINPSGTNNNDGFNSNGSTQPRSIHIPYILNGELFEIQTQDGENVTVKCCNCPPDRVYRGSVRSTGNFHMHIKRRHPDLMGKIYDMKVNALVERRDRFLRNRKTTRRHNINSTRSRRRSSHNGYNGRMPSLTQPPSQLFKIKAAYQRHQLQQQNRSQQNELKQNQLKIEQPGIHKWNMIDHFLVTPAFERTHSLALMNAYNDEQPLNYSLKQCANEGTVGNINITKRTQELMIKEANTPMDLHKNDTPMVETLENQERVTTEYGMLNSHNVVNNPQIGMTQNLEHLTLAPPLHAINSDQSYGYSVATTFSGAITPCPSDVSSYGTSSSANNRDYKMGSANLSVIKKELLFQNNIVQPLDLSVQPPSSDLSGCSGYGSCIETTQTIINSETPILKSLENNVKFNELLIQAVNTLQSLQREVHTYNETNNNWLNLEIAKFTYLHPEFKFKC